MNQRQAESMVRTIWLEVLGDDAPESIGRDDDFFELGGTSLSLIAVITKMSQQFGADFPTAIAVNGATIGALAKSALDELAAAQPTLPGAVLSTSVHTQEASRP